jgi:ATP-dependent helicase/nuclease subunit A
MTVHSSKGLEFPVVFLCDLSRKFNLSDMQDAILVDGELSVGCNRIDPERYVRYPTVAKQAIARKKTAEAVSEELRILYVAMTRPKDRLIMTYYSKNLLTELKNINSQLTMPLNDDLCASARCPGKWILMAALCRTEAGELLSQVGYNDVSQVWEYPWRITLRDLSEEQETVSGGAGEQTSSEEKVPDQLLRLNYSHGEACLVPAKLTATQLKGRAMDRETAEGAAETVKPSAAVFRQPSFRPKGLTATERGTATHLFLQFADYAACSTQEGLERELVRMEQDAFLTPEQVQAVNRKQILDFFHSELGGWLLGQTAVRREFKFSLLVDAGKWYPEAAGEQTMLQGVVDCFILQPDGITILDFKTDRNPDPERYRPQMDAYAHALSTIYNLPVKSRILYFFSTGLCVKL